MDVKDIDSLKNEIPEGQSVTSVNILFLDISSSCTGYAVASVDFTTKQVEWKSAGALWLNPNWSHQEKYCYMHNALSTYFFIVEQVDYIVVEQYSINPKKMAGVCVVPEMHGAIKAGAWENGVKVSSILPQSWRAILSIKPNVSISSSGKKKRDYKEPTKNVVEQHLKTIPDKVVSNITGKDRQTPSDLYDAVAIGMAWLDKLGFKVSRQKFNNVGINPHIGVSV
jgi:Holliday junction resolvasome RuvABC endonuclease subunit